MENPKNTHPDISRQGDSESPRLANGRFRDEYYKPFPPDYFAPKDGSQKLDVAIIGAGIAGLTAAIALLQSGHHVQVYTNLEYDAKTSYHLTPDLRAVCIRQRDWCSHLCWPECCSHTRLLRVQLPARNANANAGGES